MYVCIYKFMPMRTFGIVGQLLTRSLSVHLPTHVPAYDDDVNINNNDVHNDNDDCIDDEVNVTHI